MQMTGEQHVAAPRSKVWDALNDPVVLAQCVPGCQSLTREADDTMAAVAEVKIGPIGARFRGTVKLSDIDPLNGCTITGSGNGGIAGSAKGGARVRLADAPDGGTVVRYDVEAEVGGRMAQLGGPIIDATARNLAGKFFTKFGEVVAGTGPVATAPVTTGLAPAPAVAPAAPVAGASPAVTGEGGAVLWGWVVAILAALLAGYVLGVNGAMGGVVVVVMALLVVVAAAAFAAGRRGGRP